jgi:hypothetical protein
MDFQGWEISISIVTRLQTGQPNNEVRFLAGAKYLFSMLSKLVVGPPILLFNAL